MTGSSYSGAGSGSGSGSATGTGSDSAAAHAARQVNFSHEAPNDESPEASPSHHASTSKAGRKTPQAKQPTLASIPFPMARVKRLIKSEGDTRVSLDATYLIAKAVGLFLDQFVQDAFEHMIEDNRNSLSYKDLATHVSQSKRSEFLADFVPEKVTVSNALSNRVQEER